MFVFQACFHACAVILDRGPDIPMESMEEGE